MTEHFDVGVVGAGISGIGAGYHLQAKVPSSNSPLGKFFDLLMQRFRLKF